MEEKKFIKPAKRNTPTLQKNPTKEKRQNKTTEFKETSSFKPTKSRPTSREARNFDNSQRRMHPKTKELSKNAYQRDESNNNSRKSAENASESDFQRRAFAKNGEGSKKLDKKTYDSKFKDRTLESNDKIGAEVGSNGQNTVEERHSKTSAENKSNEHKSSECKKNAEYKRSSSKYSKEKIASSRSAPKYEYNFDDADENEKELILRGTISDRLNGLALLCARNPSEKNYKQLLQFCENQRNDVIYSTLKLVRDLIKEKKVGNIYIKGRIIKSFEMGCKNQYIKEKTIEIVGVLMRADIYTEDFINILVSRLIEKGKALTLVENALRSAFFTHEALIFEGIEDFYYKNDEFRCQYNLLKFIKSLEISSCKDRFFNFYNQALNSLDEYSKDQKDLMVELIVNGLSSTISENDKVDSIELIRSYVKSPRSIISTLNLLIKTQDPYTESYILKVSRTSILRNTKHEPEFLNMIYKLNNKDLFAKLIDNSFYYSVPSILSLMFIGVEKRIEINSMFSLRLFASHYSPVVRDVASKILNQERIMEFDPFDSVYLENLAASLANNK